MGWLKKNAGAIIGGLFGFGGQRDTNKRNLQIAREQMAFQERMSNTAYQRAAKDMEAAGLNRILALGGPSSTPQGAKAEMANEGLAALQGAVMAGQKRLLNQQAKTQQTTQALNLELEAKARNDANSAFEDMRTKRFYNDWMAGQKTTSSNAAAHRLFNAQLDFQRNQADSLTGAVASARNAAKYYNSGIGSGLQMFGMGSRDLGPAVIGATGMGAASAWFRKKATDQFKRIYGKGL